MEPSAIGHYRIIRKLGAGGMGTVFLAEDSKLGRRVAIKMLSERWDGNDQARRRLINEAKAAAALDHPNICSIYEVGEEGGRVFIVMQYIDGQSLAERIWKTPLPPGEVVDIGIQAAHALAEAHAAGVIHRDIKPQNIVITPRGQLKVLDFGLAKVGQQSVPEDTPTFERLTEFGNVVGTPGFMSPEQLRGKEADARSDIFSLGVTLYECATGVHAFERGTALEVSLRVVTETPTSPSVLNPAVPPRLDRIIARAMAKDPAGRYDSADSLRSDLVDLRQDLDGPGAVSRPVSTATATATSTENVSARAAICKSAPDTWGLKPWVQSIRDSVLTGATYSAGFPMTSDERCNGIGQVYYGPVVLITDALSYSATDIFAAGFQDNEVGLVLGTSGNTGAGGANFWWLDDLLRATDKDPKSPFKALPKGAAMIVAMRRRIRVGLRAGSPLEEFGVEPDKFHLMTRRDILEDNCDLMATAARLIRQRPSFRLSITPVRRKGTRVIALSAESKLPPSKAGRGISRVDIYANNRPVLSIDAHKDMVPSTQVTIGKAGSKPTPVEVGAYDHAGRLVAFRRTAVR